MIGPQRPPSTNSSDLPGPSRAPDSDSDDDAFAPPLPPSLIRPAPVEPPSDDDEIGPAPPSASETVSQHAVDDGVAEFEARERARLRKAEEDAKPKRLVRDDWMLVPPSESELLNSMDPTKLKRRGFSQASTSAKATKKDTTLWTETPEQRAQRQADEVLGKKRKAENTEVEEVDQAKRIADERKRRRDAEMRQLVDSHNKSQRSESLVDHHQRVSGKEAEEKVKQQSAVWDRERDMALGGRLMDEGKRKSLIQNASGLSGKFGGGTFL